MANINYDDEHGFNINLPSLSRKYQEAYDKMQRELVKAREGLTKILTSKDVKATLLDMVERNELNRSLLALLDENIANAQMGNQNQNNK
uniref:Uncharacterized protein n=1 Tax=Cucumis sativus TaxID=3659 RepID=A0A0A0KE17_CUCSA